MLTVSQADHLPHPQTVEDGDEVQSDLVHAGEGVVTGQVLRPGLLARQHQVEEERLLTDVLHVGVASKLQPGVERSRHCVDRHEDYAVTQLVQLPLTMIDVNKRFENLT